MGWSYLRLSFPHISTRNSCNDLLSGLVRRGLVKQIFPTNSIADIPGSYSAYAGFDATSDSLHIGNLLVIVSLLHWQRAGHKTILVIGDATAEIGDPSEHKEDRKILSKDVIKANCDAIESNVLKIFDNHERYLYPRAKRKTKLGELILFRNSEWYGNKSVVDFFTQAGRQIRVGDMLSRTSVKSRMESKAGINFTEFSYQVFQSYDWLHLFQEHNCKYQFGGNDQLGNITSGYNLISGCHYQQVYGALLPLIQSETGDKFGKSAGNAVCLSSHRTSPFDFYQFFMRLPDTEINYYLKLFTFLELEEIENIYQKHINHPDSQSAQKRLAEEATLLVHGGEGLEFAKNATNILFHSDITALCQLKAEEVNQVFPQSSVSKILFEPGTTIYDLTMKIGCFLKKEDANRIIKGGGVYLNFERVTSPDYIIVPDLHILSNGISLIRIGKKNYYVVCWK
ncbi:tyrosine--tRNA ligase, mitochondrial isoform X2 [Parasteatoda tepidariorum]|uniref:tyrosine--tRNA ligase, mitochondrial isoform X2 n=1 Tax=Parasteatoda tepidariorum TaxID=114398 RepID=UPI0039BD3E47